jgi:hypothetical protein
MDLPGDPGTCPGNDEVADYLKRYSARFELPVRAAQPAMSVRCDVRGGFTVETPRAMLETEHVLVGTDLKACSGNRCPGPGLPGCRGSATGGRPCWAGAVTMRRCWRNDSCGLPSSDAAARPSGSVLSRNL